MERLLEQGAFSDADLLQAVTSLSGDEFLQVNPASLFSILGHLWGVPLQPTLFHVKPPVFCSADVPRWE